MPPLARLSALLPSSQILNGTLIYVAAEPAKAALIIGHDGRGFTVTASGFPLSLLSGLLVHLETHLAAHGSHSDHVGEKPSVIISTRNLADSQSALIGVLRGQALPLAPIEAWLSKSVYGGAGSDSDALADSPQG